MNDDVEKNEARKRFKEIRKELGYTQTEFAKELGISVSLCKGIETGRKRISLETGRKLEKATGMSVDYIMRGKSGDFEEVWAGVSSCDDSDKIKIFLRLFDHFGNKKIKKVILQYEEEIIEKILSVDENQK